ncbi:MAG: hypothetical protein M0Q26_07990 [Chitinophagaceae bacterium]|nr:hypothetical protein [Chitinophagaceae bacterium]MDP1764990.1 hypothetical protein [Sediminibacterium sp.]MDP1812393.1 hypothetical protein [Sediminibacterium sp.]MDP3129185.1 hypothetical protein [Sediminibacterium sp.]
MNTKLNYLTFVGITCLSLFTACAKNGNNSLANFQPEVANITDNFQLQATNVTQVSTTIDYNWTNSGAMATIDKSGILTSGTARILIFDKNGTIVSTSDLKVTGAETTAIGVAGLWKIRLELSKYDGTLNVRVQKK